MATLSGQTIATSYEQLLSLPNGGLNGASLVAITDGDSDTACVLEISTTKALIKGSGNKLYFHDEGDEHISAAGGDLTIAAGTALNITADVIDLSDATKDITLNAAVDALNFDSSTLSIDADNNRVGIGTAAPEHDLHVITPGQTQNGIVKIGGDGTSVGLELVYDQSSSTTATITSNPTANQSTALFKLRVDGDQYPNQLVLKGDGYVGIGTATPQTSLQVTGRISITANASDHTHVHQFLDNGYLQITPYNNEKIIFDTTGNIGIGTASPAEILHVANPSGGILVLERNDGASIDSGDVLGEIKFAGSENSTNRGYGARIVAENVESGTDWVYNDKVGTQLHIYTVPIDGTTLTKQFTVDHDGGIYALNPLGASNGTGADVEWVSGTKEFVYDSSDAALKTNVQAIPYGLAEINKLKPCMYDMHSWKIDTNEEGENTGSYTKSQSPVSMGCIGMIAQEIETAMPKLVRQDILKGWKSKQLTTVLVKAIQELSAKVEALENA